MTKPLEGIKILDVTTFLSGPYCTLLLGGLGAEVIKVENPRGGDPSRISPPFAGPKGASGSRQTEEDLSFGFLKRCRNKKSITINLKDPRGKELFKELAKKVDVVMENFRPGTMDRLGLGAETLRELNPSLIYCSLSGFGLSGAYAKLPAFDIVIQAMSGIMSINGDPASPPVKAGLTLGDLAGGLFSAIGILAALQQRHVTGEGQVVEVSMLDAMIALLLDEAHDFWAGQGKSLRMGNRLLRLTPFNSYPTSDGFVVIASGNDKHWERILKAIERDDLIGDARYAVQAERTARADEVDEIITAWTKNRDTETVVKRLQDFEVPCAPVREMQEVLQDEELRKRGTLTSLVHPTAGSLEEYASWDMPVRFSNARVGFDQPAPRLGQHNNEVFGSVLGLTEREISQLKEQGVI